MSVEKMTEIANALVARFGGQTVKLEEDVGHVTSSWVDFFFGPPLTGEGFELSLIVHQSEGVHIQGPDPSDHKKLRFKEELDMQEVEKLVREVILAIEKIYLDAALQQRQRLESLGLG